MIDTAAQAEPSASQVTSEEGSSIVPVSEVFRLNENFKSNQFRLNLPIPAYEEDGTTTKKQKVV